MNRRKHGRGQCTRRSGIRDRDYARLAPTIGGPGGATSSAATAPIPAADYSNRAVPGWVRGVVRRHRLAPWSAMAANVRMNSGMPRTGEGS